MIDIAGDITPPEKQRIRSLKIGEVITAIKTNIPHSKNIHPI
jgi:hypothetical protein